MKRNVTTYLILIIVTLLLLFSAFLFMFKSELIPTQDNESSSENKYETSATANYYKDRVVYFDGVPYCKRANIETLLVIGLDSRGEMKDSGSYNNDARADTLLLFVMDHTYGNFKWIPINRDTMTEYNRLGLTGEVIGSEYGQIALSHTYGSGLADSCENTLNAVNYLLYDIGIDHYLSMTMDAIGIINDAVGGVTVVFDEDYTELDERYLAGTSHTFVGDEAEGFVRARSGMNEPTNTARMKRQKLYMNELFDVIYSRNLSDDELSDLYDDIKPYIVTDCDISKVLNYFDGLKQYTSEGALEIAGEAVAGDTFMEFYVDNDSLKEILRDTFYYRVYLSGESNDG